VSTIHQKICLCELFRNAFPPIISPIIINIIPNNIFPAFFIILSPFIFICSYNITFNDICQYNKKILNKNPVLSVKLENEFFADGINPYKQVALSAQVLLLATSFSSPTFLKA
jgi:hypothetical protein